MDDRRAGVRPRFDAVVPVVQTVSVPAEVAAALRAAGYGVRGPAGVGAGGPVWTAVGPSRGGGEPARVVVHAVTVPAGEAGAAVTRRLDALRGLDHPHLARVVDVLAVRPAGTTPPGRPGDDIVVLVAEVPGTTLAGLLAARRPLSAGEVVALAVPVAGALQTLHAAGLVHGDVSPGNIVVRPDGHPVLIDLLGAVQAGRSSRRGTPGFVAPEVAGGPGRPGGARPPRGGSDGGAPVRPGVPPAAPADVFALATVALAVLDPAELDGPLGQELAAARAPDPVVRPTAGELAAGCFARATPSPITLPDAGVLARTALAQLAAQGRTVSMDRRSRHRAPPRRRPAAPGALRVTGVAVGVVTALGATVAALGPVLTEPAVIRTAAGGGGGGDAAPESRRPDPAAAAVELTHRRAEVLAGGDVTALTTVVREGSSAHAADLALLEGLGAAGVRLDGLAATGVTSRALGSGDGAHPAPAATERVEVSVTSGVSAHRRLAPDGVVDVAAQPPRTVVLTLVWTSGGWRVDSVRDR